MKNKEEIIAYKVVKLALACNGIFGFMPLKIRDICASILFIISMPLLILRIVFFLIFNR